MLPPWDDTDFRFRWESRLLHVEACVDNDACRVSRAGSRTSPRSSEEFYSMADLTLASSHDTSGVGSK